LQAWYSLSGIERVDGSIRSAVVSVVGGDGYRLPTEAEWEYACRAGSASPYGDGHAVSSLDKVGWFGGNQTQSGNSDKQAHPVGQKWANAFGLFDLHGNVSEWCQDWYDYNYYDRSPRNDPSGPTGGSTRVVRGGSWNDDAFACRAAQRAGAAPNLRAPQNGFRVVRSLVSPAPRRNANGVPPYRIVVDLRDGGTVDLYKNESFDSLDGARQRLAGSKLFGRVGNIRIIDGNGNQIE
jgi:Sulfatase-modifying factor enzyme 1